MVARTTAPLAAGEIASALREDPVYVSPDSLVTPDADRVRTAIEQADAPIFVAVVPQAALAGQEFGIDGLTLAVQEGLLDARAVVVVVSDNEQLQAAGGPDAGVDASKALDTVLASRLDAPFDAASVTGALLEFVDLTAADQRSGGGVSRRTVGVVGLIVVGLLGAGLVYGRAQRAQPRDEEGQW